MTQKKELEIYRNLLINLHTSIWTGNKKKTCEILQAIGKYSYARTNGNGDFVQEKKLRLETLLNLEKL